MGLDIKQDQRGFTIIEMLIATAILSTILVLVTFMMINIGSLYYKGINQSKIQNTVRSLTDEIGQQLQYSDIGVTQSTNAVSGEPNTHAYCIGRIRYTYVKNIQIGTDSNQSDHVLWRDTDNAGDCKALALNVPTPGPGGEELMTPNSRLYDFTITPLTSPYNVNIGAIYGNDEFITGSDLTTRCMESGPASGNQFCSRAHLETTVAKRV